MQESDIVMKSIINWIRRNSALTFFGLSAAIIGGVSLSVITLNLQFDFSRTEIVQQPGEDRGPPAIALHRLITALMYTDIDGRRMMYSWDDLLARIPSFDWQRVDLQAGQYGNRVRADFSLLTGTTRDTDHRTGSPRTWSITGIGVRTFPQTFRLARPVLVNPSEADDFLNSALSSVRSNNIRLSFRSCARSAILDYFVAYGIEASGFSDSILVVWRSCGSGAFSCSTGIELIIDELYYRNYYSGDRRGHHTADPNCQSADVPEIL